MTRVQLNKVSYTGGHPAAPKPGKGLVLVADDQGIHLRRILTLFTVPWTGIAQLETLGPQQAESRFTMTRFAALGPLALAAKKMTSSGFLHVVTVEGYDLGFEVPKTSAGQLQGQLARWTSRIGADGRPAAAANPPSSPQPATPAAAAGVSVADELAKLHDLVQQGLLTPEQFEVEKARLLDR